MYALFDRPRSARRGAAAGPPSKSMNPHYDPSKPQHRLRPTRALAREAQGVGVSEAALFALAVGEARRLSRR